MNQEIKFDRVDLKKDTLILNALYQHTGQDTDDIEKFFYQLNPLVFSTHIPADGEYKIPVISETSSTTDEALLLWE